MEDGGRLRGGSTTSRALAVGGVERGGGRSGGASSGRLRVRVETERAEPHAATEALAGWRMEVLNTLWIQPESRQLRASFSKLRKLSIHGIYVEFDLLWTINLLEAAPTVEIFDIEVYEHPCIISYWARVGVQRVQPSWKKPGFTSCNKWQLRELYVTNFSPLVGQHMLYVRKLMDRAPNLKTVVLKEDEEACKDCEATGALPNPVGGLFPRTKKEQETIAQQLRDNMVVSSSAQIIFKSIVSTVVF